LKPEGLINNQGISYYGVFLLTIIPYCFAMLGSAYFCVKFALHLHRPELAVVKYSLMTLSLLIVGLVITPDNHGRYVADAHVTFGSTLFIVQLLLSGWFTAQLRYGSWAIVLTLMEFVAGIVSYIYLTPKNGYLIESQIVFQLSFGVLALYSLPRLLASKPTTSL
jgi:hypothetical protein